MLGLETALSIVVRDAARGELGWDGIARADVADPGPDRRAGRARPRPGAGAAGEPDPGGPGRPVDGGAGHAGQPQPQHPLRRDAAAGAGGGDVPATASRRCSTAKATSKMTRARRARRSWSWRTGGRSAARRTAASGETFGEAVFTTAMTGYQETLTDPSYHRQVVVQTAPHIGNTGVNGEDDESGRIWVAGYVVRDPARAASNWRATGDLEDRLAAEGIVGICGIDTRALTRHLRERGAMRAGVSSVDRGPGRAAPAGAGRPPMLGADLSAEVSTPRAVHGGGRGRAPLHGRRARPRHQAQRDPPAGRPRGHDPRAAGVVHTGRAAGGRRRTRCSSRPGPGDPATADAPGRAGPGGAAAPDAAVRDLLRQPDPGPGARLRHLQAAGTAIAASTSRCWTGTTGRSR